MFATILIAALVQWEFPRTASCHEGIPFADGRTGVLVWGGGDTINLTVGRGDLWDHRGGYAWTDEQNYTNICAAVATRDNERLKALFRNEPPANWGGRYNPYMLPLGRVVVKVPGRTIKSGTLDTDTGLGELTFADGARASLAMSRVSHAFSIKFSDGVEYSVRSVPATDFKVWNTLANRGFKKAKVFDGEITDAGGFWWELPADEPVWIAWRTNGREFALHTGRGDRVLVDSNVSFDSVASESTAQWAAFWREGARVKVPDSVVQQIFDLGMYKFGAMTDPDGFAAGLQGQWLEDDRLVPWNGDYHFNINVQECYSPAYRGGHFKNLMPLFRMVLSWRPLLRENARKFAGIEDGYSLPHSVDDRGVCIGGFWTGTIDHASTAWIASMMMRYVRYSGDIAFLRSGAFDFMNGAMNVYRAMMEERNGKLSIPIAPSPEWGDSNVQKAVGRDPSFQLAAAHRLAIDLTDAAKMLGEKPNPMWGDIRKRLPTYTNGPGGFQLFEGQSFVHSHRHHSHMAGIYPFDTIDFGDTASRNAANATYSTWVYNGTGEWSGWCVPWAAILHVRFGSADAAVQMLRNWKVFYNNPGHGSLHDAFRKGFTVMAGRPTIMQMDGQCAAVTAVMELMAHETNGTVEFFNGCPEDWKEVSFENLALSDGRRVSGSRKNGEVSIREIAPSRQNANAIR